MKVTIQKVGRVPLSAEDFGTATQVPVRTVLEKTDVSSEGYTILVDGVRGTPDSLVRDGQIITLSAKPEGGCR